MVEPGWLGQLEGEGALKILLYWMAMAVRGCE